MKYIAMDFETGNAKPISACSVGITTFTDHAQTGQQTFLIRPPEEAGAFHWFNIKIHGIRREMLKDAPSFDVVWEQIAALIEGNVLVCHNAMFDTAVLCKCLRFYGLSLPDCRYVCTVKIAQRVWPELENHKLDTVAQALSIPLNHHEAGSDATACGYILQAAMEKMNCDDVDALAACIGMRIGTIAPEGCVSCSTAQEIRQHRIHEEKRAQRRALYHQKQKQAKDAGTVR